MDEQSELKMDRADAMIILNHLSQAYTCFQRISNRSGSVSEAAREAIGLSLINLHREARNILMHTLEIDKVYPEIFGDV